MPETARILQFPRRPDRDSLAPDEATAEAQAYLSLADDERTADARERIVLNADLLLAACRLLKDRAEVAPADAAQETANLYHAVSKALFDVGLFDEKDYFLGELALIAGGAFCHLGRFEDAGRWLDRAESAFRHIVNAAPQLAKVSYARLVLFFQIRRGNDVLELIPSLLKSFQRLEMTSELRKAEFLEAMSLKQCSRDSEAFTRFGELRDRLENDGDQALLGHALIEIGGYQAADGHQEEALKEYTRAAQLLTTAGRPMALAHLKVTIGESLRDTGRLGEALVAFRSAVGMYAHLGMATFTAYTRIFVADMLLRLDHPREAEWEILAALPTIEEQKMVPEGFAAVALLKESARRRKTDPNALSELREHLKANQN